MAGTRGERPRAKMADATEGAPPELASPKIGHEEHLETLVKELQRGVPRVTALVDLHMRREREELQALRREQDARFQAAVQEAVKENLAQQQQLLGGGGDGGRSGGDDKRAAGDKGLRKENERLKALLEDQRDQIDVLVAEVAGLRTEKERHQKDQQQGGVSSRRSSSSPPPTGGESSGRSSGAASEALIRQLRQANHGLERSLKEARRAFGEQTARFQRIVADLQNNREHGEEQLQQQQEEDRNETELQARLCDLEIHSSEQASLLSERDAELIQTQARLSAQTERARALAARNEELQSKVLRLERLHETAKEVALHSEARLQDTCAQLQAHALVARRALGESTPQRGREGAELSTEVDLGAYLAAQAWWLHLAGVERDRGQHESSGRVGQGVEQQEQREERLRQKYREQSVEVANLRQEVLAKDIEGRKDRQALTQRLTAATMRIAALEQALFMAKQSGSSRISELERTVNTLRGRGNLEDALAAAREELSKERLLVIKREGDMKVAQQLLQEEKMRFTKELHRADHLQDILDRRTVAYSIRMGPSERGGLTAETEAGGQVSALQLMESFAGTARRQAERIRHLERSLQGVQLHALLSEGGLEGEGAQGAPLSNDGALSAPHAVLDTLMRGVAASSGGGGDTIAAGAMPHAALLVAAEAQRSASQRKGKDQLELDKAREDLCAARSEADALRQEKDKMAKALLPKPDVALLEKLHALSREVEALRGHNDELRAQMQSRRWRRGAVGAPAPFSGSHLPPSASAAAARPRKRAKDFGDDGSRSSGRDAEEGRAGARVCVSAHSGKAHEVVRLQSLLNERSAQVKTLAAAVEALQTASSADASRPTGGGDGEELLGLNQVGVHGLAQQCVSLAVKLSNVQAQFGMAERRAESLRVERETFMRDKREAEREAEHLSARLKQVEADLQRLQAGADAFQLEALQRLERAQAEFGEMQRHVLDADGRARAVEAQAKRAQDKCAASEKQVEAMQQEHMRDMKRVEEEHLQRLKEVSEKLYRTYGGGGGEMVGRGGLILAGTGAGETTIEERVVKQLIGQWREALAGGSAKGSNRGGEEEEEEKNTGGGGGGGGHEGLGVKERRNGGGKVQSTSDAWQRRLLGYLLRTLSSIDAEGSSASRHACALESELKLVSLKRHDAVLECQQLRSDLSRMQSRLLQTEEQVEKQQPQEHDKASAEAIIASLQQRMGSLTEDLLSQCAAAAESRGEAEGLRFRLEKTEQVQAACEADRRALRVELVRARAKLSALPADKGLGEGGEMERLSDSARELRRKMKMELRQWWDSEMMPLCEGFTFQWGEKDEDNGDGEGRGTEESLETITHVTEMSGAEALAQALIVCRVDLACGLSRESQQLASLDAAHKEIASLEYALKDVRRTWAWLSGEVGEGEAGGEEGPQGGERYEGMLTAAAAAATTAVTAAILSGEASIRAAQQEVGEAEVEAERLNRQLAVAQMKLGEVSHLKESSDAVIAGLQRLHARLRGDEERARESLGERLDSVRTELSTRAEAEVREVKEVLSKERGRFTSELAAVRGELIRREAEIADLAQRNQELELVTVLPPEGVSQGATVTPAPAGGGGSDGASFGSHSVSGAPGHSGNGVGVRKDGSKGDEVRQLKKKCHALFAELTGVRRDRDEAEKEWERLVADSGSARANVSRLEEMVDVLKETVVGLKGELVALEAEAGDDGPASEKMSTRLLAAKVTEAQLHTRLKGVLKHQMELRRMMEKRDRRIEELKRDLSAQRRLLKGKRRGAGEGESGGGEEGGKSPAHHQPEQPRQKTSQRNGGGPAASDEHVQDHGGPTRGNAADGGGGGDRQGAVGGSVQLMRRYEEQRAALMRAEQQLAELGTAGSEGDAAHRAGLEWATSISRAECSRCAEFRQQRDEAEIRRLSAEKMVEELRARHIRGRNKEASSSEGLDKGAAAAAAAAAAASASASGCLGDRCSEHPQHLASDSRYQASPGNASSAFGAGGLGEVGTTSVSFLLPSSASSPGQGGGVAGEGDTWAWGPGAAEKTYNGGSVMSSSKEGRIGLAAGDGGGPSSSGTSPRRDKRGFSHRSLSPVRQNAAVAAAIMKLSAADLAARAAATAAGEGEGGGEREEHGASPVRGEGDAGARVALPLLQEAEALDMSLARLAAMGDAIEAQGIQELRHAVRSIADMAAGVDAEVRRVGKQRKSAEEEVRRLRDALLRQQRAAKAGLSKLKRRFEQEALEVGVDLRGVLTGEQERLLLGGREGEGGEGDTADGREGEGLRATRVFSTTEAAELGDRLRTCEADKVDLSKRVQRLSKERVELVKRQGLELHQLRQQLRKCDQAQAQAVSALRDQLKGTRKTIKELNKAKANAGLTVPLRASMSRVPVTNRGGGGGASTAAETIGYAEMRNRLAASDDKVFTLKAQLQEEERALRTCQAERDALRSRLEEQQGLVQGADPSGHGDEKAAASATAVVPYSSDEVEKLLLQARLATAEAQVLELQTAAYESDKEQLELMREASALRIQSMGRAASGPVELPAREGHGGEGGGQWGGAHTQRGHEKGNFGSGEGDPVQIKKQAAKVARAEVSRLKAHVEYLEKSRASKDEMESLSSEVRRVRASLVAAKEDGARKAKVIASMRAQRVAEEAQARAWEREAAEALEKLDRVQRDAANKALLLKDLKEKRAELAEQLRKAREESADAAARLRQVGEATGTVEKEGAKQLAEQGGLGRKSQASAAMPNMSSAGHVADKLKEALGDRNRLRQHLATQRGRMAKMEQEEERLREQLSRAADTEAALSVLKRAVARKHAAYRSAKQETMQLKQDFESYRQASESWQIQAEMKVRQQLRKETEGGKEDTKGKSSDSLRLLREAVSTAVLRLYDIVEEQETGGALSRAAAGRSISQVVDLTEAEVVDIMGAVNQMSRGGDRARHDFSLQLRDALVRNDTTALVSLLQMVSKRAAAVALALEKELGEGKALPSGREKDEDVGKEEEQQNQQQHWRGQEGGSLGDGEEQPHSTEGPDLQFLWKAVAAAAGTEAEVPPPPFQSRGAYSSTPAAQPVSMSLDVGTASAAAARPAPPQGPHERYQDQQAELERLFNLPPAPQAS